MSDLLFKNKPQLVNYDLYSKYSPVPIESNDGMLLFSTEERENLLKLIIYNVGIKRTLEIIDENKDDEMTDNKDGQYFSHITNDELLKRTELSDDKWIELSQGVSIIDVYSKVKDKVKTAEELINVYYKEVEKLKRSEGEAFNMPDEVILNGIKEGLGEEEFQNYKWMYYESKIEGELVLQKSIETGDESFVENYWEVRNETIRQVEAKLLEDEGKNK